MKPSTTPVDEAARLATPRSVAVVDRAPLKRLDRITRLARRLFDVPIAFIRFEDECGQLLTSFDAAMVRQAQQLSASFEQLPLHPGPLIVRDTLKDQRLASNALVQAGPRVRFYAGQPLYASDGTQLATLCILDQRPRTFAAREAALLADLARFVEAEMRASQLAITDCVTGLSNRAGFVTFAARSLALCSRLALPAIMFVIEVEELAHINRAHGAGGADKVLRDMAAIVSRTFRASDVSARLDERSFGILAMKLDEENSGLPLERLSRHVKQYNQRCERRYQLSYRVGVAVYDLSTQPSIEALVETASSRLFLTREMQLGGG